ncbi:carboxy terminal-processing peptidase [Rhodoferax sp.]|uniref:carboxy terminal-processing peptidase n=1 Tax=Rhodoferax sp. TaxID=50421 RepID=UPI0027782151|nr:carboxy terminal-processing peptidase [Rhodoferax sp.]
MKKTLLWIALAVSAAAFAATPESSAPVALEPALAQIQAASMTADLLTRFHYSPRALDDAMSQKIFDRYLKSLDSEKVLFTQADIDQFAHARDKLDDAIKDRNLTAPFAMFNLYQQRLRERLVHARGLLAQSFDFSKQESYPYLRTDAPWAQSESDIQDLWRRRVKNDWLRLKLAGKDDKAIRATLEKRYDYALANLKKLKSEDVFQLFMNAYAMSIEPHTNYLGPKATEDFDISMRLSLVGIGAVLQERDDTAVIRELVPGGPAARSGKLKVGDRIVGVAQAADPAPTDVLGWRLDDVVRLIRGTEDSVVKLNILPADASPDAPLQVVTLVRKKITLEQQAAKKSIIEVKDAQRTQRIGVIALPTFYQDFEARAKGDQAFKSATRDVARLLAELKKDRVDSVLIDLRNNGGGSLNEAIELTNLFIGSGPVVQQRDARGTIRVEGNGNATVAWDGQLGVLINRGSASASEIFAAAMQDYGRALIIGESSFGKGTVQTIVNLDAMARSDKPKFGDVRMTVAQFYRVNGGTTQLRGVTPDIQLPTFLDADSGEAGFDNALPWGQIKSANYQPLGDLTDILPMLQLKHEQRIAKDPEFRFLKEDIGEFLQQKSKKSTSLNEVERRKERDAREAKLKGREASRQAGAAGGAKPAKENLQDDGLQGNERTLAAELAAEKAGKAAKDVFQLEAANILADQLNLIQSSTRLAQQVLSGFSRLKPEPGVVAR